MIEYIGVFLAVQMAMIATALWEARIEGKNIGASEQVGWRANFLGIKFTEYHFWLWIVAYPLLLILPLIVNFSGELAIVLISSYLFGMVWEDFMWFVFNPYFNLSHFNSKEVKWYPWLKIGKFEVPLFYAMYIVVAFLIYLIYLLIAKIF